MSRQALRKHCQRYHTSSNDMVLPKFPGTNEVVNVAKKTNHLRRPILRVDTNLPLTPCDKSVPPTPIFSSFPNNNNLTGEWFIRAGPENMI